ncbi:ATP-binding cassette domain-containing protein [Adlercreutzia sp. R7]|uniref:ATP-binding cassette domain-containing protein n=1 Tax=Adlercreutzia wanghongyangiae TaxID=3111451 RepID=A0ABU6IGM2_9ACTN|nr:ATP-binding cassette domain-containing protein [Adlercreutzia sp. R7]
MTTTEDMVVVEGLRQSFGGTDVLKGLSFRVRKGSVFALLGDNGAGKTTTIRILSTLLRPDGGKASIGGFDVVANPREVRELISLTGQFAAVDEVLTGRENLTMVAKLRHVPDPDQAADSLLRQFDMMHAADRPMASYSGGMRRRIDIAMSLVGNPRLIFLDEPTTGLDPKARLEVWNTVRSMKESGVTVFLTTQYLEEAEVLADRIAILDRGAIIADGTLEELKRLIPPAKKEYVERQPSLEDIFLAITGERTDCNDN